jgi:hypothetical protein
MFASHFINLLRPLSHTKLQVVHYCFVITDQLLLHLILYLPFRAGGSIYGFPFPWRLIVLVVVAEAAAVWACEAEAALWLRV